MDRLEQARQSISRTIDELRKSGSEAFADGLIDDAARIGSWIKVLQGLVSTDHPPTPDAARPANPSGGAGSASVTQAGRLSRTGKHDYPRFHRSKDDLVKVGWSKTEKSEYEHKAPREAVDATATAVAQVAAAGRQFTANDVFAHSAVVDMPQYQVYLALAWFRSTGLVEQIGKQGYRCAAPEILQDSVRGFWQRLANGR